MKTLHYYWPRGPGPVKFQKNVLNGKMFALSLTFNEKIVKQSFCWGCGGFTCTCFLCDSVVFHVVVVFWVFFFKDEKIVFQEAILYFSYVTLIIIITTIQIYWLTSLHTYTQLVHPP